MPGPTAPHIFQSQGSSGSVETLGDDMRGGLLTDSDGRGFRSGEIPDGRPHMEGTAPNSGSSESGSAGPARGIGGTHLAPALTPEQMMAMANEMEQQQLADAHARMADGPAARRLSSGSQDNGYNTELTSGAEKAYRGKFGDHSDKDYDLRGAFASHLTDGQPVGFAPDTGGAYFPNHLPDTFKKPNHETFSNESQYADQGHPGSWGPGDKFNPSAAQQGVPSWLNDYMQHQPFTDPYHQVPMSGLDAIKANKYLTERERLKYTKSLRK